MQHELRVKRIYDDPSAEDGFRILVDHLWPRGVSRDAAQVDLWAKELTSSNDLGKWFHEGTTRYAGVVAKYTAEFILPAATFETILDPLE